MIGGIFPYLASHTFCVRLLFTPSMPPILGCCGWSAAANQRYYALKNHALPKCGKRLLIMAQVCSEVPLRSKRRGPPNFWCEHVQDKSTLIMKWSTPLSSKICVGLPGCRLYLSVDAECMCIGTAWRWHRLSLLSCRQQLIELSVQFWIVANYLFFTPEDTSVLKFNRPKCHKGRSSWLEHSQAKWIEGSSPHSPYSHALAGLLKENCLPSL